MNRPSTITGVGLEQYFDDGDDEPRIPWSASYVNICILLPSMAGLLNSFAWSGYALHVRTNGWSLVWAGVALSAGSMTRLLVQQVIFRLGIWTCAFFACLQGCLAVLALIFPEEEAVIFLQAGAIPAFDVTVAIESLTYDTWHDSEVMVGQAQSTVLSVFTIAYALAATFGGVIYDLGGWTGVSVFHTVCSFGQMLVFVFQPALRASFLAFLRPSEAEEDEVEDLDQARVTSVVPITQKTEDDLLLPGMVEEAEANILPTENPRLRGQGSKQEFLEVPQSTFRRGASADGPVRNVTNSSAKFLRSVSDSKTTAMEAGSGSDSKMMRRVNSRDSELSEIRDRSGHSNSKGHGQRNSERSHDGDASSRRKISKTFGRSSICTGFTAIQPGRMRRRTVLTEHTLGTTKTGGTMNTAMTNLSKFSSLTKAGENFRYNFGIQNGFRLTELSAESWEEEEDEADESVPRGQTTQTTQTTRKGKARKASKGLPKDLRVVSRLMACCAFTTNLSYAVEWATFAIFFQEQHGWTNATWAGICQTLGDLLAGFILALLNHRERVNLQELQGLRWLWHSATGQPYILVLFGLAWAMCNSALCVPVLPVAISSQVLMGTLYVFSVKAVTDMNLFYSLGSSQVFLQMQVQCKNVEALGCLIAGGLSFPLYEYNPVAPYGFAAGLSLLTSLTVLVGFYRRVGFGQDLETAESLRAQKTGVSREKTWKVTHHV